MTDNVPATPSAAPTPAPAPVAAPRGLAITALLTGLIGLVLLILFLSTPLGGFLLTLGAISGLLGIIFGAVALRKRQSKGMSIVGIVAGGLAVLLALSGFIFALIFVGAFLAFAG